jgi:lysine 2,3-aminomutase
MHALQGHISGLCIPHYAIDLPGGGGKVPLLPEYIVENDGKGLLVRNYQAKKYYYPLGRA